VLGLAVAAVAGRLVGSLLTVAEPLDAVALLSAAALIVAAAFTACDVPARRAARVDAATMLRGD
jgi:ABC-type lipoprotein release transport system permease subunit